MPTMPRKVDPQSGPYKVLIAGNMLEYVDRCFAGKSNINKAPALKILHSLCETFLNIITVEIADLYGRLRWWIGVLGMLSDIDFCGLLE